jgi:hypothetical protein
VTALFNGIGADHLEGARWSKATRSDGINECVEVAEVGDSIAFRNSRDPHGPALIFTRGEFSAFLDGATKGEFSHLAG